MAEKFEASDEVENRFRSRQQRHDLPWCSLITAVIGLGSQIATSEIMQQRIPRLDEYCIALRCDQCLQ